MKKSSVILVLLLLFGILLVACGGAEETTTDEPATTGETTTEETTAEEPAAEEPAAEEEVEEEAPAEEETMEEETMEEEAAMGEADLDGGFMSLLSGMEAYNTIGLDALNTMMVEDAPFLLDVRNPGELEENGWIEGAVHIPLRELGDNLQYLPSFDTTIVSYCASGWRCTIAMTALEALGWENVLSLKGGSFTGWVEAGYPFVEGDIPELVELNAADPDPAMVAVMTEMFQAIPDGFGGIKPEDLSVALVENPEIVLIDVRRTEEPSEKGFIDYEQQVHFPLETFLDTKADWPTDMDTPIVVYCGSGHRSTMAMTMLWAYGYTDVHSMKGGFNAWSSAGLPSVGVPEPEMTFDMDAAFQTFIDDMERYNTIGLDDLNVMMVEDAPFLLDVRRASELEENGWIEGAVHIPLSEVADNIQYLPSFDTTIVSYCGSGWRCTIAMTALEAMGWENVLSLKGGSFGGWVAAGYPIVEGEIPALVELNAADPDPAAVAAMQMMLQNVPEGFGVITADDFNVALLENPDLTVIDNRRLEELEANGVIEAENWMHMPLESFIEMKDMWPADLDAPIVVYCGSGHRSTISMSILWSYGYTDVRSLRGGFGGWAEVYPTVEYAP